MEYFFVKLKLFSKFFHVFDESACRWVKTEQKPCNDQSIPISSTISPIAIAPTKMTAIANLTTSTTFTTTTSSTTTTTSTTKTSILIEVEDDATGESAVDLDDGHSNDHTDNKTDHSVPYESHHDSCVILDSDWVCSDGQNNRSLCFKICSNDAIDHKRCICKDGTCSWHENGNQCKVKTTPVPNLTSSIDQSAMHQSQFSVEDPSANLGLAQFSSLDSKTDLMSLIHQINLSNSGNINVSFQLR